MSVIFFLLFNTEWIDTGCYSKEVQSGCLKPRNTLSPSPMSGKSSTKASAGLALCEASCCFLLSDGAILLSRYLPLFLWHTFWVSVFIWLFSHKDDSHFLFHYDLLTTNYIWSGLTSQVGGLGLQHTWGMKTSQSIVACPLIYKTSWFLDTKSAFTLLSQYPSTIIQIISM